MSSATHPDDLVTLARLGDWAAAQLVCGRLEAEGIASFLPDEAMAAQAWHLYRPSGGIRVQVRQADVERAQQILAEAGRDEVDEAAAREGAGAQVADRDDGSISPGDRAAFRALRVALVSLLLMGLVHPYSLWLAARALARPDVTPWGRKRAFAALLVSLAGTLWMGLIVYRFAKLAG